MPTYESLAAFQRQWEKLDPKQRGVIRRALAVFIVDLRAGGRFSPEPLVHKLANAEIWSVTWAKDGRAVFRYGQPIAPGEVYIVWEAVGVHTEVYNFKELSGLGAY